MALHKNFPKFPHAILNPDIHWFPADEALRESSYEKLLPPLVHELRKRVKTWRDKGYEGATDTSIALLNWWFNQEHRLPKSDGTTEEFQYYFAQQEAVENIIYLYDVVKVKDKYDLLRFDSPQSEGVELGHKAMGEGTKPKTPIIIEIDNENRKKDIDNLDIEIPVLTPRISAV